MPSFEHIKIHETELIRATKLEKLGQVNTICGPNNSGKSTLLRCLSRGDSLIQGHTLTMEILDKLVRAWVAPNVDDAGALRDRLKSELSKDLLRNADATPVIYSDEHNQFVECVKRIASNAGTQQSPTWMHLSQTGAPSDMAMHIPLSIILANKPPTIAVIPPKRSLDVASAPALNSAAVEFDGRGLTPELFRLKNQQQDSAERKLFEKLVAAFAEVSGGCSFDVVSNAGNALALRIKGAHGTWVEAAQSGLGLHDLLTILYWSIVGQQEVLIVEEPENHMHATMQRRLLQVLKRETEKQYFFSTHSNVFLDSQFVDRVFTTSWATKIEVADQTSRAQLLNDLGYTIADNLVCDLVVLVEGPSDIPVLQELIGKVGVADKHTLKFWPLGGDIMDQTDLTVLTQSMHVVALIDGDPKSSKVRERFVDNCNKHQISVTRLARYAIENYFTIAAIRQVFPEVEKNHPEILPDCKVAEQIGFSTKKSGREIAKVLPLEAIESTDLMEFIRDIGRRLAGRK
jgi:AAA domain, putative AbiEii toxin, Type IV TA system